MTVAKYQPMKLAAMEGLYKGNHEQAIVAFGILNPSKQAFDDQDHVGRSSVEIGDGVAVDEVLG